MAKLRVGFGSDFNITGQKVGIGTTNPTALLEVAETAKADFNITGVTTLTSYGGFVAQNQRITEPTTIKRTTSKSGTFDSVNERETGFTELGGVHHGDDQYFNTLSEDLVVEDGKIFSINNTEMYGNTTSGKQDEHSHSSYVCAGSLEQVSVTGHFSVPCGGINERQETPIEGIVRFNDDLATLEFFNGNEWRQFTYNQGQSGRAIWGGSGSGDYGNTIDYVTISTRGNAVDFGDRTYTSYGTGGFSSETRGIFFGGRSGTSPKPNVNSIDYITMASTGNAIDFGDFTLTSVHTQGCSSSTRGFRAGGWNHSNAIEYIEIATVGNGLDFGDLTMGRHTAGSCSSPTRGFVAGGNTPGDNRENSIEVWTMASKGNAVDFGQLTSERAEDPGTASNHIKGIICGGYDNTNSIIKSIETLLLSTQGVNIDFGNLTKVNMAAGAASNHVSVVNGGGNDGSRTNTIELIIISSSGDSTDFGDLTEERTTMKACSDSHGGLGGF